MKITGPIILIMLVSITLVTNAQEAADADLQLRQKSAAATPPPSGTVSPIERVPELPEIDDVFKQTSLGKEADERRLHIEWRELSNRVVSDPDVVAAKRAAQLARTDLEKRERLREYYNTYYGRMRSMTSNAEMKAALDQLKTAHL